MGADGQNLQENRKSKGSGSTHLLKVQGEALLTSACSTHVKNKGDLSHIRISKRQIKNEFDTLSNVYTSSMLIKNNQQ